jgi:hypothetical protein
MFYEAAGPGCMSMMEYYFMKKTGCNLFIVLFSEPRIVYDELIHMLKGENSLAKLIEKVVGSNHELFLEDMKKNDPLKIVTAFEAIAFFAVELLALRLQGALF